MAWLISALTAIAAVLFFLYKVAAGSFEIATSLSLTVTPAKYDGKTWGLVTVKLERGENWSAIVECAELKVRRWDNTRSDPIRIVFKYLGRETFELSPGEKTQYAEIVELPAGKPAVIEALFVMEQRNWVYDRSSSLLGRLVPDRSYVFGSVAVPPFGSENLGGSDSVESSSASQRQDRNPRTPWAGCGAG